MVAFYTLELYSSFERYRKEHASKLLRNLLTVMLMLLKELGEALDICMVHLHFAYTDMHHSVLHCLSRIVAVDISDFP